MFLLCKLFFFLRVKEIVANHITCLYINPFTASHVLSTALSRNKQGLLQVLHQIARLEQAENIKSTFFCIKRTVYKRVILKKNKSFAFFVFGKNRISSSWNLTSIFMKLQVNDLYNISQKETS